VSDAKLQKVAIFGATSGIAQAVIRRLAARGADLHLVARSPEKLDAVAGDARVRGARNVTTDVVDLDDAAALPAAVGRAFDALERVDLALAAQGVLATSDDCEKTPDLTGRLLHANFVAPAILAETVALRLARTQGSGTVAVFSSVAGDRGRQSNFAYGAAKGGLSIFLAGLRNRVARRGVHVLTVKPGMVDTPMTAGLPKGPLFASPERVARDVLRAVARRRDVVYTPWYWRAIMLVIRAIPERVFKRLRL
jgi:short-subunit dehydrogenase